MRPRSTSRSSRCVIDEGAMLVAAASCEGVSGACPGLRASSLITRYSFVEMSRSTSCRSYHWFSRRESRCTAVVTRWTDSSAPASTNVATAWRSWSASLSGRTAGSGVGAGSSVMGTVFPMPCPTGARSVEQRSGLLPVDALPDRGRQLFDVLLLDDAGVRAAPVVDADDAAVGGGVRVGAGTEQDAELAVQPREEAAGLADVGRL